VQKLVGQKGAFGSTVFEMGILATAPSPRSFASPSRLSCDGVGDVCPKREIKTGTKLKIKSIKIYQKRQTKNWV
jgi:hypothetical protein